MPFSGTSYSLPFRIGTNTPTEPQYSGQVGADFDDLASVINNQTLALMDFGAVGDGITNDSPALNAALAALDGLGGVILLGRFQYLFDTGFEVPQGVVLVGENYKPKETDGVFGDILGKTNTVIWLNPAEDYIYSTQSGLQNCSVLMKGMVAPTTTAEATALVASFAGTAIIISGNDIIMQNLFIGGFEFALAWDDVANFYQRPLFENIFFDCTNGMKVGGISDAGYIAHIHAFPSLTGHDELLPGFPTPADGDRVLHRRSGIALEFVNDQGWGSVQHVDIFGWTVGCKFTDVGNFVLVDVGMDTDAYGVLPMDGVGYWALGFSQLTFLGARIAGQEQAFKLETDNADSFVYSIGGYFFTNATHVKIESTGGDFNFIGNMFGDVANSYGDETEPVWQVTAAGHTTFTNNSFHDPNSTYPSGNVFKVDAGTIDQFNNIFTNCVANIPLGPIIPPATLVNAVNDAAAQTGGVPVGGPYRNGSVMMIRTA